MSTGKWLDPAVPHAGWTCADIEDLGEPAAICEMCEVQEIRFVHTMTHPEHPALRCGCICAGYMEEDLYAAQTRERSFRNLSQRKARWLTRRWRWSEAGNAYLNAEGYNVVVFATDNGWSGRIENRTTGDVRFAKRRYGSQDAARLAAFDAIQWLKEHA